MSKANQNGGGTPELNEANGQDGEVQEQKPGKPENKDKPVNLYRFLRHCPQKKGIEALLISKFKEKTMSLDKWEIAVKNLLATKTN
ncbi:MAG: hypothetical protein LBB72_01490 [Spirochaetaceae bacterium]|nr:hypothetical protein [Spirochaetaceae bacterium]